MTTEAALLAAIAADPDDDDARLVFADWLAQRGDPRGELIQLEIAQRRMLDTDERRRATTLRITALLEEHGERWRAPFLQISGALRFGFDRGLIGTVQGPVAVIARHAPQIATRAALVTGIDLVIARDAQDLTPLAGSPLLATVRRLGISANKLRVTGWEALGGLPVLRSLELASVALSADDLAQLFRPPNLPALTRIALSLCRLNRGALEPLALLQCTLRELELPACHLGSRLGHLLGGSRSFHALTTLGIPGNELGRDGLAALLPALRHIEHLDLRGCALTVEDLPMLLDPTVVPRLRSLELGGNALGDAGAEHLARFAGSAQLVKLHLGNAGITARGARTLAGAATLANLRSLVLSGPRFDAATDAALLGSPHLARARIYAGDRHLARGETARPAKPRGRRA